MPVSFKTRTALFIFLGTLAFSLLFQTFIWTRLNYVDRMLWLPASEEFSAGHLFGYEKLVYGYPAGEWLILASGFVNAFHASVDASLRFSMIAILSLVSAAAALAAYALRPGRFWWLAVAGMLIFHHLYAISSPPSVIAAPLAVLFLLLLLLDYERRTRWSLAALGVCTGLMLANRIDISLALAGTAAILYLAAGRWKRIIPLGLLALAAFAAFDPWLVAGPVKHFQLIYLKGKGLSLIFASYFPFMRLVYDAPLAFLAAAVGCVLAWRAPAHLSMPRPVFIWLFVTTAAVSTALFAVPYHPSWYFFPFLFMWEALFPLFLLPLFERMEGTARVRLATEAFVMALFGLSHLALMYAFSTV